MDCLRDKFIQGKLLDGRFQTVAPLNHGSFGMVFLANDTLTGEQVAIKCLTKPSSADPSSPLSVDDRSEEMQCHMKLGQHPNLVNLVSSFETQSHIFLVLEYCSMGDLYEAIRNSRGPLETEHVRDFMLQLIDGVEFMHSKGLYHRDIKPENIFLCQDGSMKLGDFGLATSSPWSFEACVGSDRYMAPEQYEPTAAGYSPAKADIWSIGICLLNILFAKNPFVTPTESDILFADYSRDRQSLFDVFPNMSQDTFEVLRHSIALNPEKRSLAGMREAIMRAVTFTTDDESLDDFCTEDRDVVAASAHREPLRTPSIQTPQVNPGESFPWAKALQVSPQQQGGRRLSVIPDTESYSEDLFPASEVDGTSWYSTHAISPSIGSTLDSSLGASFKSIKARQSALRNTPRPAPISESLPTSAARPIPSMSLVFGKGSSDQVSKSWSDLWDEEESELEEARLRNRQAQNSRTWSKESNTPDIAGLGLSEIEESSSMLNVQPIPIVKDEKKKNIAVTPVTPSKPRSVLRDGSNTPVPQGRHSPSKNTILDKWAALGKKRMNHTPEKDYRAASTPKSKAPSWRKEPQYDHGTWTKKKFQSKDSRGHNGHQQQPIVQPYMLSKDWRRDKDQTIKPKRSQHYPHIPIYSPAAIDDEFDFVGGWQDLHP
ncbi:serine/threonine protein kinase [Trichophyton interdigitale MR816]|uniref:Serine/threonine-protein kinase ATG1 n=1 Tax=Trichophyton interdigitale (strain MR816) TaxID=1215338 RepID=A0A059JBQ1_TRIIM|nr:serine/threonine protein kinase [Trichophyton interdigitale H6]KDB25108.1 serine/threonine protein kinase [Trichophyton interdigitale MR816]